MPSIFARLNCCSGTVRKDDDKNMAIDKLEKKKIKPKRNTQKILLLGTGESGKSTFLKQMKIITGKRFTGQEIIAFKDIIYDNIYKGILFLLQARATLKIPWAGGSGCAAEMAGDQLEEHFRRNRSERRERSRCGLTIWNCDADFIQLAPLLKAVWQDASLQIAFDQRTRLITEDFSENTRFYMNHLHEIAVEGYRPTEEDIVWSRRPTDSIIEEEILIHGTSITFIDVGGQTKERRKWCQTFTDMTSVLFLIASSHFDETYLDRVTGEYRNKLREAMSIFESLINQPAFRRVSIILFFNKTDLLKEKLQARLSSFRSAFPELSPQADEFCLTDVQTFLVELFAHLVDINTDEASPSQQRISGFSEARVSRSSSLSAASTNLVSTRRRQVYRHFTTAVDKRNIETVFNAMQDTILQSNLRRLMMS